MRKTQSLLVSETFFKALETFLPDHELGYLHTFNNCREEGLCLINYNADYVVWAYECRNGDDLVLVFGTTKDMDLHNMFNEKVWNDRKCFAFQRYDLAVKEAIKFIENKGGLTQ